MPDGLLNVINTVMKYQQMRHAKPDRPMREFCSTGLARCLSWSRLYKRQR